MSTAAIPGSNAVPNCCTAACVRLLRHRNGANEGQQRVPSHDALVPVGDTKERYNMRQKGRTQGPKEKCLFPVRCSPSGVAQILETANNDGYEEDQAKQAATDRVRNILIGGVKHVPAPVRVGLRTDEPPIRKMADTLIYQCVAMIR